MSNSISYSTPSIVGRQRRAVWRTSLGVLTLHKGRIGFMAEHFRSVFDRDLSEVVDVTPKGHGDDHTAFVIAFDDGMRWACTFWWRNPKISPVYVRENYFNVVIEDVDMTDKWQAQETCATWLRILADPTAPDPRAWHPDGRL